MKRRHLFEIADEPWCPALIRGFVIDYLEQVITVSKVYEPIVEPLQRAVKSAHAECVIDLCSGGGGPWRQIGPAFAAHCPAVKVVLTDLHQNTGARERLRKLSGDNIQFHPDSVNALRVPPGLTGFRTLFSAFHHFKPAEARAILRDAVESRSGIGLFEGTQRHPKALLGMLLVPLAVWILTPRIRPFSWSRLLWTYLIPLVPFVALFDGLVSCLRTYTVEEMKAFTDELSANDYRWEIGEAKAKNSLVPVTYLTGYPTG
jgi:hypothetical protein